MNISQAHTDFVTSRRSPRRPVSRPRPAKSGFSPFDHESLERQFLLIEECHAEQLVSAAALALREGRYRDAYMYADRRCRIGPIAGAPDYLLRASALSRLGEQMLAQADLKTALDIDPNHTLANLTALRTATGRDRLRYASAIVQREGTSPATAEAIDAIAALGYLTIGVFTATVSGIVGWFAWKGSTRLQFQASSDAGALSLTAAADPTHPLRPLLGNATDVSIPWPPSSSYLAVTPPGNRALILNGTLLRPSSATPRQPDRRPDDISTAAPTTSIAVIIPVYGDLEATQLCLNSLASDRERPAGTRFIVVNDASPDPRLHALVQSLSEKPGVSVLTHKANLGFARSINDALAALGQEDVVVLNADTVVPPGFIARLRSAAYSAPDIGTVTPFSNNGEYTSFPLPFRENPLPNPKQVMALDRLVARVNAGRVIDMPNGTAFCMYVTRRCLNAIGPLSTNFGQGYYEDVEFCLRASAAGFRNVCAADVYVGHAGSKSFGSGKRALVMRNLPLLEAAYPSYRAVSAAFMDADPLASVRRSIETAALGNSPAVYLLVAADSTDERLIARRCATLAGGDRVLLARVRLAAGRINMEVRAPDGGMPQSIACEFAADAEPTSIRSWLEQFPIARLELLDVDAMPATLARAVLAGPFKISLVVPQSRTETALPLGKPPEFSDDDPDGMWALAIHHADTLLVNDGAAHRNLTAQCGSRKIVTKFRQSQKHQSSPASPTAAFEQPRLGVIGNNDAATLSLVAQLVANTSPRLGVETVFIGTAFDDLRLMAAGRVFCTGEIDPADLPHVTRLYQISHFLIVDEIASYALDEDVVASGAYRIARIVPAAERISISGGDLVIPAGASVSAMANALNGWTTQRREAAHG